MSMCRNVDENAKKGLFYGAIAGGGMVGMVVLVEFLITSINAAFLSLIVGAAVIGAMLDFYFRTPPKTKLKVYAQSIFYITSLLVFAEVLSFVTGLTVNERVVGGGPGVRALQSIEDSFSYKNYSCGVNGVGCFNSITCPENSTFAMESNQRIEAACESFFTLLRIVLACMIPVTSVLVSAGFFCSQKKRQQIQEEVELDQKSQSLQEAFLPTPPLTQTA